MVENASQLGGMICSGNDPRITRIGRLLRKTKIDEFPQLINVLKGDMSLVGPRPELWPFVELFYGDYQEILDIRPGITDLASLKYRDEAAILGRAEHPDQEYITHVLPDKIRLAKYYVRHSSLVFDLHIILTTLSALFDASDTMINGTIASLAPADVVAGIDCQNSSDRETIIPVLDRFSA
jgi:lipopolysaccharide/colanic/teichoic acid biosynthesis glycosyltransferase